MQIPLRYKYSIVSYITIRKTQSHKFLFIQKKLWNLPSLLVPVPPLLTFLCGWPPPKDLWPKLQFNQSCNPTPWWLTCEAWSPPRAQIMEFSWLTALIGHITLSWSKHSLLFWGLIKSDIFQGKEKHPRQSKHFVRCVCVWGGYEVSLSCLSHTAFSHTETCLYMAIPPLWRGVEMEAKW